MARIIIADDDQQLRVTLVISLERMGHQVLEARDGNEAVRLVEQEPPDILITDIVMPDKEGLEVISEVRRKFPAVKIIAMSGGGYGNAAGYLKIAHALGANLVIAKPFPNEELAAKVNALLGGETSPVGEEPRAAL